MTQILEGVPEVVCHMDDILVTGATLPEHDMRLEEVLSRLKAAGVTLNEKCEFAKTSVKFLGHILSENEIQPHPSRKSESNSIISRTMHSNRSLSVYWHDKPSGKIYTEPARQDETPRRTHQKRHGVEVGCATIAGIRPSEESHPRSSSTHCV